MPPKLHFKISTTDAIECLCSPLFSDVLGFLTSFQLNSIQLTSYSLLIILILSFFYYIFGFFKYLVIYCSTSYFWCVIFQFHSQGGMMITSLNWISTQSESHCLGHLVSILCSHFWGISSLRASCPPRSSIVVIYFCFIYLSWSYLKNIFWFEFVG